MSAPEDNIDCLSYVLLPYMSAAANPETSNTIDGYGCTSLMDPAQHTQHGPAQLPTQTCTEPALTALGIFA